MQTFKCCEGMTWDIKFTVYLRRKIRKTVGVDICTMLTQETLQQFDEKPEELIEILWYCVEAQANERGISMEQFLTKHLDEDLLVSASELLFDACIEYAPEKKRAALRKILNIYRESGKLMEDTSMKHINDIETDNVLAELKEVIENSLAPKSTSGKMD